MHSRRLRQNFAQSAFVRIEKEFLKRGRAEHKTLQHLEIQRFDPAKYRRPTTCLHAVDGMPGQSRPVLRRPQVMFDVIAVVEKWRVIEMSMRALRTISVLEIPVNVAERQPGSVSRQINLHKKL